jgi:hypothetical protein
MPRTVNFRTITIPGRGFWRPPAALNRSCLSHDLIQKIGGFF